MRRLARIVVSLLALCAAGPVWASPGPEPVVIDFEAGPGLNFQPGGGWAFRPVRETAPQGAVFARLSHDGLGEQPAMANRYLDAAPWRGQPIRLSAWLRATGPAAPLAGLWLRIDGGESSRLLFFDNMSDRPVTPGGWARHEIIAYVPADAARITFGVMKAGPGALDMDDVVLAAAGLEDGAVAPEAQAYLDEALDALQARHINRATVDWTQVREISGRLAAGAETPSDIHPVLRVAVGLLGERHSSFRGPSAAKESAAPDRPLPRGEVVAPAVGRLILPELMPRGRDDPLNAAYREALVEAIARLEGEGVCRWVVDLRGNGGGNMWPMLNGLEPLLGVGPFGAFGDATVLHSRWVRRAEQIVDVDLDEAASRGATGRLADAPVAVLLGPGTASSGEMTAIAFHNRERTRTFGAPTAGLTTANGSHRLPDGAILQITTTGVHDGAGRFIEGRLTPDEAIPDEQTVTRALGWLQTQDCATPTLLPAPA
ncbi:Peptidase family S41 [compost metagenome]|jgi:hypothetical protein